MKTVVVGMSGGVDSSVSALLLKNLGYQVIGLFMKNWEEAENCPSAQEFEDVARVCEQIDIPYYNINFVKEYKELVFEDFLTSFKKGLTPNPDILCNKEIKFKVFLEKALSLGADFLATGHYCRLSDSCELLRGKDPYKDQSYFLYAVDQKAFEKVLFPIGHLPKSEVRAIAKKHNLYTAEKKDSTGICFIGKKDFKPFLQQFLCTKPGLFKTLKGQAVGEHDGAMFYTIGQRKGMGLGGEGEAWYVVDKDLQSNTVFVERGANHPALFKSTLLVKELNWIAKSLKEPLFRCTAKVRYRQQDTPCTLHLKESQESICVEFDEPQRAITPGQSIVFYQGDFCLGGGIIS